MPRQRTQTLIKGILRLTNQRTNHISQANEQLPSQMCNHVTNLRLLRQITLSQENRPIPSQGTQFIISKGHYHQQQRIIHPMACRPHYRISHHHNHKHPTPRRLHLLLTTTLDILKCQRTYSSA